MKSNTMPASTTALQVARKYVRDWMTPNPVTVLPSTRLDAAYKLMLDRRVRRLPVVENGALVGIVTMSDLRSKGVDAESDEPRKMSVDAVLTEKPLTISPDATLVDAARIMVKHKVSGLPVVSLADKSLIGIITESDIFRAFIVDETS